MSDLSVLVIDDHEAIRETISDILTAEGHAVVEAEDCEQARAAMDEREFDLVLSDLMLPDGTGMELLEDSATSQPDTPFIVITGHGSVSNAIEAIRKGAYEYIQKPLDLNRVRILVKNALDLRRLRRDLGARDAMAAIIGNSPGVVSLKETLAQVAGTDATVLIQGESGTGKELVANAVQALSDRKNKAYVKVNVAALPRDLLESELFGHEKGAFTGAVRTRQGRFELADGGTLFLDEISEMPVETQVKLLRVLQEHEIERVGGMETIPVDFRLVCATNADLKALVAKGEFREDLFYRINVVNARIPPLRERMEDIPLLCEYFLGHYNERYGRSRVFGPEAMEAVTRYHWPGNVRELENAVERAVVVGTGETITPEELPDEVRGGSEPAADGRSYPAGLPLDEIEKRYILSELERLDGNKTQAAKSLGIGVKTLYRKLEAWGENDKS